MTDWGRTGGGLYTQLPLKQPANTFKSSLFMRKNDTLNLKLFLENEDKFIFFIIIIKNEITPPQICPNT